MTKGLLSISGPYPINQKGRLTRDYYPFEIDIPLHREVDAHYFYNGIDLLLWDKLAKLSWRPFEEAKLFVHSLGLKNHDDWKEYCNGNHSELA